MLRSALLVIALALVPLHASAALAQEDRIVAVVNGDVVTASDVDNRGRLFALSTGLPVTPEVLARLRPQVIRQLVDERLRLQEAQRRKIAVQDKDIADAINEIEQRNGMPAGLLRQRLAGQGVALRTLIDQIRVQLAWTRVLRQELGTKTEITDADVAEQMKLLKGETGKPEYNVAEIFVPVDDPARAADAQRFADTVIGQLRAGAPFPIVAAQFSQSQTALQGGDLGWVRPNQLDPEVAAVVGQMPPGAISNPIRVPGGFAVVTLRQKRIIGNDPGTMLHLRQAFFPFSAALDPNNPTDQQKRALDDARALSRGAKSCAAVEAANKAQGDKRPADPGEVRLETVAPPTLRTVLAALPVGKATQPIVTPDGVIVLGLCSRDTRNLAEPTKQEITDRLLGQRVELASRQLQRDLRRRATIEMRS